MAELAKGLAGVAASLGIMIAASGPLAKMSPRLIVAGAGITAIAIGLNIMALAVRQLGRMDLRILARDLALLPLVSEFWLKQWHNARKGYDRQVWL